MSEDLRMRMTLTSTPADTDVAAILRRRIEEAKADYDIAPDRSFQLQALGRLARLKAALAGLEGT